MEEKTMLQEAKEQDKAVALSKREKAEQLDQEIKVYANMAWMNWVDSARCLKRMKDEKMYEALGYETFEAYTRAELNIGERQAYTYISVLEKQGEGFLKANASLGITKIALLNNIPVMERQDFVDSHDLAGMSVAEVEALVKENDGRAEQISLLEKEKADLKEDAEFAKEDLEKAEEEIRKLQHILQEVQSKPTEVAVAEPSEAEKEALKKEGYEDGFARGVKQAEKMAKEAAKKKKDEFAAEKEKAIKDATAAAQKELEDYKTKVQAADAAKAEAIARADELQKQMAVTSSPEATRFSFFFEQLEKDYQQILQSIAKLKTESPEVAEKYSGAMQKYHGIIPNRFAEIGFKWQE